VIGLLTVPVVIDLDGELIYSIELEDEDVPELQIVSAGKGTPAMPRVHVVCCIHVQLDGLGTSGTTSYPQTYFRRFMTCKLSRELEWEPQLVHVLALDQDLGKLEAWQESRLSLR
jgi:hypothetical protein